jgi:hypothetical protein
MSQVFRRDGFWRNFQADEVHRVGDREI